MFLASLGLLSISASTVAVTCGSSDSPKKPDEENIVEESQDLNSLPNAKITVDQSSVSAMGKDTWWITTTTHMESMYPGYDTSKYYSNFKFELPKNADEDIKDYTYEISHVQYRLGPIVDNDVLRIYYWYKFDNAKSYLRYNDLELMQDYNVTQNQLHSMTGKVRQDFHDYNYWLSKSDEFGHLYNNYYNPLALIGSMGLKITGIPTDWVSEFQIFVENQDSNPTFDSFVNFDNVWNMAEYYIQNFYLHSDLPFKIIRKYMNANPGVITLDQIPNILPAKLSYQYGTKTMNMDIKIDTQTQDLVYDQTYQNDMSDILTKLWNPRKVILDKLKEKFGDFQIDNAHKNVLASKVTTTQLTQWLTTTTRATVNVSKINKPNDETGSVEFDFTFAKNGESHNSSGIITGFKIG